MNSALFMWECIGVIMIFLIGTIIHFGYETTNKLAFTSGIFAVNESIWEHCKLTFWSPLIFALIEYFFVGKYVNNFLFVKTSSAYITTISMLVLYYRTLKNNNSHSLLKDLIIFEISIIIGLLVSYNIMLLPQLPSVMDKIAIIMLFIATFIFYLFTYCPPKLPIFYCSVSNSYGTKH